MFLYGNEFLKKENTDDEGLFRKQDNIRQNNMFLLIYIQKFDIKI